MAIHNVVNMHCRSKLRQTDRIDGICVRVKFYFICLHVSCFLLFKQNLCCVCMVSLVLILLLFLDGMSESFLFILKDKKKSESVYGCLFYDSLNNKLFDMFCIKIYAYSNFLHVCFERVRVTVWN